MNHYVEIRFSYDGLADEYNLRENPSMTNRSIRFG